MAICRSWAAHVSFHREARQCSCLRASSTPAGAPVSPTPELQSGSSDLPIGVARWLGDHACAVSGHRARCAA